MSDRARRDRPLGIAHAHVTHDDAGSRAPDYDDIYCARADSLDESRHVFIDGNALIARFTELAPGELFVIGETGFGAGRNVMLAWQLFAAHAPAGARMHFVSIEAHPLAAADLACMTARWPALSRQAARIAARWPAPVAGTHRVHLDDRTTLDLYFGDIEAGLTDFTGKVNAWFLDGFAPAKNPVMWSPVVCRAIAGHSAKDATLATYSAAGAVRQRLADAGFAWQRRPGHGAKKHCLTARYTGVPAPPEIYPLPWYSRVPAAPNTQRIAIIGAGIAGATVADALARRGFEVTVYDGQGIACGASGNRDGVLNPRLAAEASPRTRFDLAALGYAGRWLADLDDTGTLWQRHGVLQLARDEAEHRRQQRLVARLSLPATVVQACDRAEAAAHAGQPLPGDVQGALFFPGAGTVAPSELCRALLARHMIGPVTDDIVALTRGNGSSATGWQLQGQSGAIYHADHVVLAAAGAANQLCGDIAPQQAVAGQASVFTLADTTSAPACVVCDTGYITPARDARISVGASYDPHATALAVTEAGHAANRARLSDVLAETAMQVVDAVTVGRTRFRSVSHDRMPLVGGVPDIAAWRADYQDLARDARQTIARPGTLWPGLSMSLAHGSNGLLRAPLAAEILASQLAGEPLPIAADLVAAIHPGRWWIRQIVKGRLAPERGSA